MGARRPAQHRIEGDEGRTAVLRDIMSTDVITVEPETTLREALEVLCTEGISGAAVVSDRQVVGVISLSDIADFAASVSDVPIDRGHPRPSRGGGAQHGWEAGAETWTPCYEEIERAPRREGLESVRVAAARGSDALEEHTVREAMTDEVIALPPDLDLPRAAARMIDAGVHRVLVMEHEQLIGIASTFDFMRVIAEQR